MANFYMMIGVPGSGKSTYCKKNLSNCVYIGSDSIRKEYFGDEEIQTVNFDVFSIARSRIVSALKEGNDVVFDATNYKKSDRKETLSILPEQTSVTMIFMATPLKKCLDRNVMRKRRVPARAIHRIYEHMEYPTLDEADFIIVQ